jgi:transposase InsO family protein
VRVAEGDRSRRATACQGFGADDVHAARAPRHPRLDSPEELGSAIFEWIEAWYNPRRRHTSLGMLAPHEFETLHTATVTAA